MIDLTKSLDILKSMIFVARPNIANGLTTVLTAFAMTLCITLFICNLYQRKYIMRSKHFFLSWPHWLLVVHFTGGLMLSSHSLPYLVPETLFHANSTLRTGKIPCLTSTALFHIGFALFFGSQLLMLHRLAVCKSRPNYIALEHKMTNFSPLIVGIFILLTCIAYLSLWFTLHFPSLPGCTDLCHLNYLFIVENTFLIFGFYLTYGEMSWLHEKHLVRKAFALSIIIGIVLHWIRAHMKSNHERVTMSAAQSTLYVVIFMFMTQVVPVIKDQFQSDQNFKGCILRRMCSSVCRKLCCVKSPKVSNFEILETHYLSDKRRLSGRTDVQSLPSDPDAPLSVAYY